MPDTNSTQVTPKLSILMMAYNQGKFIDEAIQSVVDQNLPFEWELIIGDDASSDNTNEIVSGFQQKYSNNIRYIKHEKNIGLHANYVFLIGQCKGKFIALLEADDYWIDSQKTARQIEFMEKNPSIAWSFTDGRVIDENGETQKEVHYDLPAIFNLEFYLQNFFNPLNNSVIFLKSSEPETYPPFFSEVAQWDTVLHYLRATKGDIGYVPVDGQAWRRHSNATSFSTAFTGVKRYQDWITINKNIIVHIPKNLHKYFKTNFIAYEYISLVYLKNKRYVMFIYYLLLMIINKPIRPIKEYKDYFWKIRNQ